jgi:hypothetical protein
MCQIEKAGDDGDFVARENAAQHKPFGDLVARPNEKGERGDPAVRFRENGFGGGHGQYTAQIKPESARKTMRFGKHPGKAPSANIQAPEKIQ